MSHTLRTDRVRLAGFLKRKEGVSKEEFSRRWLLHAEIFKGTKMADVILKYEQVRSLLLKRTGVACHW